MQTTNNRIPDAVQWSEGMLLSPQHMQQNDIYWHAYLSHRAASLTPYWWGVSQLAIDDQRFAKGVIKIEALECTLPDGLAVTYPRGSAISLELDVSKETIRNDRPLRIWLAVPKRGAAAAEHDSALQRYDSVIGDATPDENTGQGEVYVERIRPRLELRCDEIIPPQYCACPLMELKRNDKGALQLASFHPPMLRIGASEFLGDKGLQTQLRKLAGEMWTKIRELTGDARDDVDEDDLALIGENRRQLDIARRLAMALPRLNMLASSGETPPAALYATLADVVGHVASVGTNPVPLQMEPYYHEDCISQFQLAIDFARRKLALINTSYERLPFARVGETVFSRWLPETMQTEVIVEVQPRAGQSQDDVSKWLANSFAADDDLVPEVERRRITAKVRALNATEISKRGLRASSLLFFVENQSLDHPTKGVVDSFHAGGPLCIKGMPGGGMPAGMYLYRFKSQGGAAPAAARRRT